MTTFLQYPIRPQQLQAGQSFSLSTTPEENEKLAQRFNIQGVEKVEAEVTCTHHQDTLFSLECKLQGVFLLQEGDEDTFKTLTATDHFVLSFTPSEMESEDDLLKDPPIFQETYDEDKPFINLGEILVQYVALMLPMTIEDATVVYTDAQSSEEDEQPAKKNPFEALAGFRSQKQ